MESHCTFIYYCFYRTILLELLCILPQLENTTGWVKVACFNPGIINGTTEGGFEIYNFPLLISSTTPGSSKVEVSPNCSNSPSAIFRKIRRIILPLRVFGKPDTNWILSG